MNKRKYLSHLQVAFIISVTACGLLPGSGVTSAGDWVPLTANRSTKVYQLSSGMLVQQRIATFLRDSNGSTYQRDTPPQSSSTTAMLTNALDGNVYQLNCSLRQAVMKRRSKPGTVLPTQPPTAQAFHTPFTPESSLGNQVISGVQCEGWRLRPNSVGTGGEIWVAPSLNFLNVQSKIIDTGHQVQIVVTLENIQAGTEPDPQYFQIPQGFALLP